MVRHWNEDEVGPCPIKFQPPDEIFRLGKGLEVDDSQTEKTFLNAQVCSTPQAHPFKQLHRRAELELARG